jgi:hypothetical protein
MKKGDAKFDFDASLMKESGNVWFSREFTNEAPVLATR